MSILWRIMLAPGGPVRVITYFSYLILMLISVSNSLIKLNTVITAVAQF